MTACTQGQLRFQELNGRVLVGDFEGGKITSDAGLVSTRRVLIRFASGWPMRDVFYQAVANLRASFG